MPILDGVSTAAPHSGELALTRLLALALPDDAKRSRAIQEALRVSRRSELPTVGTELLQFVRAHLAPQLAREVAPNLILALIDDMTLEVQGAASERGPVGLRTTSPEISPDARPAEPTLSPSPSERGSPFSEPETIRRKPDPD
jgi:hypothetical protein